VAELARQKMIKWQPWIKANWHHVLEATIFAVIIAIIGIALLDRRPVIEATLLDFERKPAVFYPGEEVKIKWSAKELRRGCGGEIYPLWIDSTGTVVDTPPDPVPVRYPGQANGRPRKVPSILKPGNAIFAPQAYRWCPAGNFLQHYLWPIHEKLPEVKFTVVEKP
jgi:hypothetical protein